MRSEPDLPPTEPSPLPQPPAQGTDAPPGECSTIEAARLLGLAVRSVQLMVDRGELQAWKTPGGHRRITLESIHRWHAQRHGAESPSRGRRVLTQSVEPSQPSPPIEPVQPVKPAGPCVLLIEDSRHFQNLVSLLVRQRFPQVNLQVADDGIAGLALAGRLQPAVLLVDILLPGIDGAALITSLRSHPAFGGCRLIVITSLSGEALEPYRFALTDVPVVHKPALVAELPALLAAALADSTAAAPSNGPSGWNLAAR